MDTGAQVNLIRKDMMPSWLFRDAEEKLNLRTANGQKLDGGEKEICLSLGFRQVIQGEAMPELFWSPAVFYEADIRVDAILSYPWLVRNKIGVFPHLRALALAEPEISLLLGLPKRGGQIRKSSKFAGRRNTNMEGMVKIGVPEIKIGHTNIVENM